MSELPPSGTGTELSMVICVKKERTANHGKRDIFKKRDVLKLKSVEGGDDMGCEPQRITEISQTCIISHF